MRELPADTLVLPLARQSPSAARTRIEQPRPPRRAFRRRVRSLRASCRRRPRCCRCCSTARDLHQTTFAMGRIDRPPQRAVAARLKPRTAPTTSTASRSLRPSRRRRTPIIRKISTTFTSCRSTGPASGDADARLPARQHMLAHVSKPRCGALWCQYSPAIAPSRGMNRPTKLVKMPAVPIAAPATAARLAPVLRRRQAG